MFSLSKYSLLEYMCDYLAQMQKTNQLSFPQEQPFASWEVGGTKVDDS